MARYNAAMLNAAPTPKVFNLCLFIYKSDFIKSDLKSVKPYAVMLSNKHTALALVFRAELSNHLIKSFDIRKWELKSCFSLLIQ